jgi:hypothetical protein
MGDDATEVVSLRYLNSELRLGAKDFAAASGRESLEAFRMMGEHPTTVLALTRVRRQLAEDGWSEFEASSGAVGAFRTTAQGIDVDQSTNAVGVALALRGLFARAIEREGGVLVHAAAVSWAGRAALITGVSGAGKSTLARWSVKAGATLLSDEVVGVLPDGTVVGTPFCSDEDLAGTPAIAKLALVSTLCHGNCESFEVRPAYELVAALCEQAFHRRDEVVAKRVLSCVAHALSAVETLRFTCRNDLAAGVAVRQRTLASRPLRRS